jgi:serine/threonine protein phosphatase PrpC
VLEFFLEQLCRFTKLEELYLGYNQISTIPEVFTRLRNLKKFDLQGNLIQVFPSEICNDMENLQELDLSNNMLKSFTTRGLSRLHSLKIRNCAALEVVDIVDCKTLAICSLENNPNLYLNSVPKQFMHFINFSYHENHRVTFVDAASSDMSGMRDHMEDVTILQTHLDFTQHHKKKLQYAEFAYCAVFDGHAGNDASLYSGRKMHRMLMEKLERLKKTGNTDPDKFSRSQSNVSLPSLIVETEIDLPRTLQPSETESKLPMVYHSENLTSSKIRTVLNESFLDMHRQLCSEEIAGGTTAAVALFCRATQKVYLAHVGDSKIIAFNSTTVLYESVDHRPLVLRSELERIIHARGTSRTIFM